MEALLCGHSLGAGALAPVSLERSFTAAPMLVRSQRSAGIGQRAHARRTAGSHRVQATSNPSIDEMASRLPEEHHEQLTVGDCMTTRLISVTTSTTIEEALELLVEHRITGLPVVDDEGKLIGVVSDYDLLAIDAIIGTPSPPPPSGGLFPEPNSSWKAFKEIQKLLHKTKGKCVGDVMTPHPLTVRESTSLDEAARILLGSKYRRLPVLNANGQLVGLLTRGNVVTAALAMKRSADQKTA